MPNLSHGIDRSEGSRRPTIGFSQVRRVWFAFRFATTPVADQAVEGAPSERVSSPARGRFCSRRAQEKAASGRARNQRALVRQSREGRILGKTEKTNQYPF